MPRIESSYDYIVVGAGSAGCVAACRLAERSSARVLLIEAGGSDRHPMVRIPIGFAGLIGEGKRNWNYRSSPEPALKGRQVALPRGKLMGGCSSINGMVYIRGQREDYDSWAAAGNSGWGYDDVLPLFKRSENYWGGSSQYHGKNGPLNVTAVAQRFPVADAFVSAAEQLGIPRNEDFNGASQAGVGYFDANIGDGIRDNTARAFLNRARRPENLDILSRFEVHRVLFQGNRAVGVEGYSKQRRSQLRRFQATGCIVLSAGAFNSPLLLERSGIGDASLLRRLGIPAIANSPGVGENLQDHCNNYLFFETRDGGSYYQHIQPGRAPLTAARFLFQRKGIFANPAAIVGAFFNLEGSSHRPDTQVHFAAAASQASEAGKLLPVPGVCASICQLQPRSRGTVHIQEKDYGQPPAIQMNFLADDEDRRRQLLAVKKLRDIFRQPAINGLLGDELPPLAGMNSDEDLMRGILASLESVHHAVGTCRMGTDDSAVTDPELSVRGVDGLRVADASVMPQIVSGNTHAACVMIGEKIADVLQPE